MDLIFLKIQMVKIVIIKKTVARNNNVERYESQSGFIKINGNEDSNKEYYINIGKSQSYTEIFDYVDYNNNLNFLN